MLFATLRIFLWKHYKTMRLNWMATLVNIALPIGLCCFIIYVTNSMQPPTEKSDQAGNNSMSNVIRHEIIRNHDFHRRFAKILYAPRTELTDNIMTAVREDLQMISDNVVSIATSDELAKYTQNNLTDVEAAIDFRANGTTLEYTIKLPQTSDFAIGRTYMNNYMQSVHLPYNAYMESGFLALQSSVDRAVLRLRYNADANPGGLLRLQFNYMQMPSNISAFARKPAFQGLMLFAVLMYLFALINMLLTPTVEEKQLGIREFLRIATSYAYLNLVTFAIVNVLIGMFIFMFIIVFGHWYGMTDHFSISCAAVLMLLTVCAFVSYTVLVSVLFQTVFYAKNTGYLLYLAPWAGTLYPPIARLVPFISVTALSDFAWTLIDEFGNRATVFGWSHLCERVTDSAVPYSMLDIWLYLLFDTVAYALLYNYIVQVFPGSFGTPKPYYWPVQSVVELFVGRRSSSRDQTDGNGADGHGPDGTELPVRNVVVRVRGLCKEFRQLFGDTTRAVHNVDMDICANQITVLLGHNGAGKTTAMSIISGIIPKTSGEITVNGEHDVNVYRKKIGYCPQHNVILPYFTCIDHLMFFGGLRGLSVGEARSNAQQLLSRLRLSEKSGEYGRDLSGGMKRRLCLGNALIGDTNIAILDEPSSGLDPESRRELWNILLEMRKTNTILITTHYMEEAETLADYISIMSRGEILCHGKAQQLKRRYASGYVMKLLLAGPFYDTERLLGRVQQHIPGAFVKSFVRPTLCVTVPYTHIEDYPKMLRDLEDASAELGIESISMSNASLEDVFLNCDPNKHVPQAADSNSQHSDQLDSTSYAPLHETSFKQRCSLWTQQTLAVWYKKLIYLRCHWLRLAIGVTLLLCALYWGGMHTSTDKAPKMHAEPQPTQSNSSHESITFRADSLPTAGNILLYVSSEMANSPLASAFRAGLQQIVDGAAPGKRLAIVALPGDTDLDESLVRLERDNVQAYFERTVCGFALQQQHEVLVLYMANVLHSTARCINLADNVWSQMLAGQRPADAGQRLITVNEPLAVRWHDPLADAGGRSADKPTDDNFELYLSLMPLALFFYMMSYVFMPFVETNTEFKHLQIVAAPVYWLAYFVFDALQHVLVCALLFGAHVLFDRAGVFTVAEHAQLAGYYALYGLAYVPLLYVIAQVFASLSTVYSVCTYMFVGSAIPAIMFTMSPVMMDHYGVWVSMLFTFPDYALRHVLIVFIRAHKPDRDSWPSEGRRFCLYMVGVLVFWLAFLVLVLEHIYRRDLLVRALHSYRPLLRALRRKSAAAHSAADDRLTTRQLQAVADERAHAESVVRESRMQEFAIVVSRLRKVYDGFEAVRGLDFTVSRGECFGLLGMNGAGKTTTFKMMARDVPMTAGEIFLNGLGSRAHPTRYRFALGYCPQVDALCGWMTAYETLKYMGMSRGVRLSELDADVTRLLRNTDLMDYAHVAARKYSGGTKRKLNTAMAMQTDPFLVCLDEPTTGVDPASRRFMWACIQECQRQQKNIVLTSHSMDECEFLCNRLAIMNHGQLNCIGPIQKLKQEYKLGYVMTVLLREGRAGTEPAEQMKLVVLEQFDFVLREEYGNQMCFVAQNCNATWSKVFEKMIQLQKTYACVIEDVSLSESSLEDIFLKIARESFKDTPQAV